MPNKYGFRKGGVKRIFDTNADSGVKVLLFPQENMPCSTTHNTEIRSDFAHREHIHVSAFHAFAQLTEIPMAHNNLGPKEF